MKIRILLTGAASLVGAEVLRELLARASVETLLLLMPADEGTRRRDFERLENYLGQLPASVTPVAGDLRLPRFGLSQPAWEELAASFDIGLHCAQREVKDRNLNGARQANLRPIESWTEMLDHNPKLRLHHLSTAFIGGTRRGLFTEFDLDCGQGFHNAWERSLFEAEVHLRASGASDRITVYRPSHILGRSDTGEVFHLGGAYPLLATLSAAAVLPGDARARIDLVGADYVAASMVALVCEGATGTFHLACGWEASLPVRQATALAAKGRGRRGGGARLLPRGIAWPLRLAGAAIPGRLTSRSLAFTTARDMLHQGPVFDTYLADLALEPLGIARTAPEGWLEAAVQHADSFGWKAASTTSHTLQSAEASSPLSAAEVAFTGKNSTFVEK